MTKIETTNTGTCKSNKEAVSITSMVIFFKRPCKGIKCFEI